MSAAVMNRTMTMNKTNVKKAGLVERFKKYILDNADYFAASSAMMSGNGYVAAQIMKDSRRVAATNR